MAVQREILSNLIITSVALVAYYSWLHTLWELLARVTPSPEKAAEPVKEDTFVAMRPFLNGMDLSAAFRLVGD